MPNPVKSVALVGKSESGEALAIAKEISDAVLATGVSLVVEGQLAERLGRPPASLEQLRACDLCVVTGGDGTLIRAAHLLGRAEVPIFGVNVGRLGFLTEAPRDRAVALLRRVLTGDYTAEPRLKLRVQLWREGQLLLEEEVLNDVVLNRGATSRMVELRTIINGAPVSRFRADGLIVATPTGSTAYNLAANGPILMPGADGLVMNPICPHALTQRPLVISSRVKLCIEVTAAEGEVRLSLDGRAGSVLQTGDRVDLERTEGRVFLVRNPDLDFFGILREKLRWGES